MLDIRLIRAHPEKVKKALKTRGEKVAIETLLDLDEERRRAIGEADALKNERNTTSLRIAELKKAGRDADDRIRAMREVSDAIKSLDERIASLEKQIDDMLWVIPNIPHESVPVGPDETSNLEIRKWGTPPVFGFEAQAHWDIGGALGILDLDRASKIAGSRFVLYKGWGARLERALLNYMLDTHVHKHGFCEVFPPFLVNTASMRSTGQLPKFAEDAFNIEHRDLWLNPTAEVPVTNIHRDEILDAAQLPIYYSAYSACFRSEAGSAGRDTRGVIRTHQFNKVEMVKFCTPETSYDELESLTRCAEAILQGLGLPYRVVCLSTGDTGFSAAKTYDLEVWLPSYNAYKEISSCSNFEDFQARRANIRFRREAGVRPEYVHTLNGSGLATSRTWAAILENYQNEDGSVTVPEVLRPYMDGTDKISRVV